MPYLGSTGTVRPNPAISCTDAGADVWKERVARRATAFGAAVAGSGAFLSLVNAVSLPRLPRAAASGAVIAVCIPARNEASTLPALIHDLRQQRGVPHMRVYVLDDASTDNTFERAEAAAAGDHRFLVRRSEREPPPGWLGKQAACHALSRAALAAGAEVLIFLDADVRLHPDAVACSCQALERSEAGAVSVWPYQSAGSLPEMLVQPLLAWSWMSTLPIVLSNRSLRPSTVVACGQFLVFRPAAYTRAGGHQAVAASLTEDLALVRKVRDAGIHSALITGGEHARSRMYHSAKEIRSGYGRWLSSAFGGPAGAAGVALLLVLAYLVPPFAAVFGTGPTRRFGMAGYVAAVVSRTASAATEQGSFPRLRTRDALAALLHPASIAAYLYLLCSSLRQNQTARTHWKGRPLRQGQAQDLGS